MILCDTHDQPDLQDEYLNAMRSQVVRGYIMVASVPSAVLKDFVADGAPMVFVNRRPPFGRGAFVGIDNVKAGADAADMLWSAGLRRCGVLAPAQGSSVTRDRLEGFYSRMRALGVTEITKAEAAGRSHLEIGYEAARRLAARNGWLEGLMCVSDQIAYGAYRFARDSGILVPECCGLVGIDGNPLNPWIAPWLRSIEVKYEHFGEPIVELLDHVWQARGYAERIMPHCVALSL